MPRRAPGDGSISQRADGAWLVQVTHPQSRRRVTRVARTRREAAALLRQLQDAIRAGRYAQRRRRLGDFLADYLETTVRPLRAPGTYALYEMAARNHLTPRLGALYLDELTPGDVAAFQASVAKLAGPGMARTCVTLLGAALSQAEAWGLIAANPVRRVKRLPAGKRTPPAMTAGEARAILDATKGTRIEALVTCALVLGFRKGELLGLRWTDIDLEAATVRVHQQVQRVRRAARTDGGPVRQVRPLKARREVDVLPLPAPVAAALRAERVRAAERRLAAVRWEDTDAVFVGRTGRPLTEEVVRLAFRDALQRAGLRVRAFHECRHGTASLLAALGVHPRIAQALLGHARLEQTLGTYTHVDAAQLSAAVGRLGDEIAE